MSNVINVLIQILWPAAALAAILLTQPIIAAALSIQ